MSRNKREGTYAGWYKGRHYRNNEWEFKYTPVTYAAVHIHWVRARRARPRVRFG